MVSKALIRDTITQDMLARILGCSRPTANKKLQELEQEKLISLSYGTILLLDIEGIARLSGDEGYLYF